MKLQRYTFEKVQDGWQFVAADDGHWVMAKDVEALEKELTVLMELYADALKYRP